MVIIFLCTTKYYLKIIHPKYLKQCASAAKESSVWLHALPIPRPEWTTHNSQDHGGVVKNCMRENYMMFYLLLCNLIVIRKRSPFSKVEVAQK